MPDPRPGEPRDDFVSRCIPVVLDDGTAEDNDQAVAICNRIWEDANKRSGKMEHKTFSGFVTKADEEQGIIETAFAVMGNIDEGEDIIHPGAFIKTFAERGHQVLVLDSHRTDSIMRAIGTPLMFKEMSREEMPAEMLEKYPGVTGGAFARVQMLMDTPEGKGAFIRLRAKAVHKWSFGYDALDVDFSQAVEDGKEVNIRNLRTIKLYEISPVLFSMNEATTTLSAKAADAIDQYASDAATAMALAIDKYLGTGPSSIEELTEEMKRDIIADVKALMLDSIEKDLAFLHGTGVGQPLGILGAKDVVPFTEDEIQRLLYTIEQRKGAPGDSIVPPQEKASARAVENKAINLSKRVDDVIMSFYTKFPDIHNPNHGTVLVYWVKQVWDEFLIVEQEGTHGRRLWKISYAAGEGGAIDFAQQQDWLEVTIAFVPLSNEQTETAPPQGAAITQHDQAQAGPDDSPERLAQDENLPTSKELLELELLAIQIQTLEANHEQEYRPA